MQEQQPGFRGGGQALLHRRGERAVPAHQAGFGHQPPVDALGHGRRGLAGEVDPDHPQALDRPVGDAARAVATARVEDRGTVPGTTAARPGGAASSSGACPAGR